MARRPTSSKTTPGRITSLATRPRDPSLVDVEVDGVLVGTVLRSALDGLGLSEGGTLGAKARRRLSEACERASARTFALRALARRDRSGAILERLLIERHGISEAIAQATRRELEADGWQDDKRYAATRAAQLIHDRQASHALAVTTLCEEGVPERVARQATTSHASAAKDFVRALAWAKGEWKSEKKRGKTADERSSVRASRRLAQALARRGYEEETIAEVVSRVTGVDARVL
jgi:SOS response regulatory protein OraA/RecX